MITKESLKAIGAREGCVVAFSAVYPDGLDPAAWTLKEQLRVLKHTELRKYLGWAWDQKVIPHWSMTEVDLSWANLTGANLTGANLTWADLTWANLTEASLTRADLRGADLTWADLPEANLTEANLYGATLYGADLYGADLSGADLSGANLTGANLRGAIWGERKLPAGWLVNAEGRLLKCP